MQVERSRSGLPTIDEYGGGKTNTGNATIVCGPNGEKVKPLFVPRGYSNDVHAIFVAKIGMHIIDAEHDRRSESATVSRIVSIGGKNEYSGEYDADTLVLEEIGGYENGDSDAPEMFNEAIDAAIRKSKCYHCREPHYTA
jgi:hypothetical protein